MTVALDPSHKSDILDRNEKTNSLLHLEQFIHIYVVLNFFFSILLYSSLWK